MDNWRAYLDQHINVGMSTDCELITELQNLLIQKIELKQTIFTFGNGGSAATANHFSADLSLLGIRTGTNCRSINLNSDLSLGTAVANDIHYDSVIEEQLSILAREGDLAVGFSASGNSKNIIRGLNKAVSMGLDSWAFVGFDGGAIYSLGEVKAIKFTSKKDYGLVENIHMSLSHYFIDNLVQYFIKNDRS